MGTGVTQSHATTRPCPIVQVLVVQTALAMSSRFIILGLNQLNLTEGF
jgi:hypothetical protein